MIDALPLRAVSDRALVRLIPATYHKPPALRGLVDNDDEMALLAEVEAMTSARQTAERGRDPGIDRRELAWARREADLRLYGMTHVNAAFTYRRSGGNRFNDEHRGAWYCSWSAMTSVAEVGYHYTRELSYIGVFDTKACYVELLADFIGDFPDLSHQTDHPSLHADPAVGYPRGQALANKLRAEGHRGLVYPSVRHPGGTCLVAFDPAAVQNVRPGAKWEITWSGSPDYDVIGL
ncbi:RES family NAD+ phosphorylase [Aliiroseovarius sp. S1339]|uniref:RES family NAD+ phosphorylase n=1 Tax=Aliiroseovarius sp. S1339 TaxID=2936990 RepID=UPI0020C0803F|nr:RES family NAD+ phosphorylase [Aliiroseovarius sp. S1339]